MVNGATQLLGGVPGRNLDPVLLVKSQSASSTGFILITYDQQPVRTPPACGSFFDVYFFRGPVVFECARLNQDLRFAVSITTALRTFAEHREGNGTTVNLYAADEAIMRRFRSTFYFEPCLKVQIEALTKRQIALLLGSSRCRHGIVECNEFTGGQPRIHLVEIESPEQLAEFRPTLRHGRLLLYDIEKNREIIRERHLNGGPAAERECGTLQPAPTTEPFGDQLRKHLEGYIGQLLHAASTSTVPASGGIELAAEEMPAAAGDAPRDTTTGRRAKVPPKVPRRPPPPSERAPQNADPGRSGLVAAFQQLATGFRTHIIDMLGRDGQELLARSEQKLRLRQPAFHADRLTEETAASVLALMEEAVAGVSFLKRTKVKKAAAQLLSEIYNKHYAMLEEHRLVDTFEQAYYRLNG